MPRLILIVIGIALSNCSIAHPGKLNADGCHNKKKTGEYHCHRAAEQIYTAKQAVRSDQASNAEQQVAILGNAGAGKQTRQENNSSSQKIKPELHIDWCKLSFYQGRQNHYYCIGFD